MGDVSVVGVWKSYGAAPVLRDVSLTIRGGEVHALCGQNGAGKTTLIKIMTGVERAERGVLQLDSVPVELKGAAHARTLGISVVHQQASLAEEVSVAENLFAGSLPTSRGGLVDWRSTWRDAEAMLAEIGVDDFDVHQPVRELSIARRALVALARAVRIGRQLIILDEPTSALDPNETTRVLEVVRTLSSRGVGVLYVSHRLAEVLSVADCVTVLRDGAVSGTHDSDEVSHATLVQEMIGEGSTRGREPRPASRPLATQAGTPVLETRGLSGHGFDGVSFAVRQGEIVGLAGLVGAGRSELAQTIVGLRRKFSGTVLVDGDEASIKVPLDAIKRGIVYVHEDREEAGIFPQLTVAANITVSQLGRLVRRLFLRLGRERELADDVARNVQLRPPQVTRLAGQFSGGNQQKILLGRALAMNARLLIIDEPSRGVDVGARREILAVLREGAEHDTALLVISSEFEELVELCDRVLVMYRGRLVAELSGSDLGEAELLKAALGLHVDAAGAS